LKKIFLATKNKGKIKEMKEILSDISDIEVYSILDGFDIPDVVEDGNTFEENSIKKAVEISKFLNMYVIADDSGISAEALNGRPGIYSARYAGLNATDDENNKKLIEDMNGKENRTVKYVAVITCASPDGRTLSVEGDVYGTLLEEAQGSNGFGYDPFFFVEEYQVTFGELESEIKNKISHRGKALTELKKGIKEFII
jgi:non-canonical purine NTP pyrophosphatase (RdgB/HAM1 family)